MADSQQPPDPMRAFAELGRINLSEADLEQILHRVAELAKLAVPGADEVSVTLLQDGRANTAAFTGELALKLDERQYQDGTGPCLEAGQGGVTLVVEDMANEGRWPTWTPSAREHGANSSVSVGLPVQQAVTGALNLYARRPGAFDDDAVALSQAFAGYAAVALANAHLYESTATLARQMQDAMANRAVIEQAKGILVAQEACSPDEAFGKLSKISQQRNRKLRDIAATIVERAAQQSNA